MENITIPYTYLLKCIPENTFYYGVRYAKYCNPNDFWVTYKTSSKRVAILIEKYGLDAFEFQIRKTFSTRDLAIKWENKVLLKLDVINRKDFINRTTNRAISEEDANRGRINRVSTEKHRKAVSLVGKSNKGRKHTTETKHKISLCLIGNKHKLGIKETDNTRRKKSESRMGLITPKCSCIICKRIISNSQIKNHFNKNHHRTLLHG
jgi:hypothetical protein